MMTETVVNVQQAPNNNAANNKTSDNQGLSWIKINLDYFKSPPGIIKIVELILGILCMTLASPAYLSGTHFFLFVATVSFIGTLIWIFVYLLGVREALNLPINWLLTELLNTCICTVMYLIAFIVQLSVWAGPYIHFRGVNLAAGVFGLFNTLAYGFGTYLLYSEWKSNQNN
ncbi:MARVEL domain-containing protein 1 [Agrilus planipennis]|uniref:MARVEL domain-containing protein 1 n=1 Tax=Agrilus planipennis TaxID=224129 RepID=A0A1W4XVG6_AGRPL|nr:MARVEL domain-containing protein 1 [Agrilus planipennis]